MTEDLDPKLRDALRPVDPGEDFTARVMARVAAEGSTRRPTPRQFRWMPAALAASLALVAVGTYVWHERREAEGREAREQVLEALRVTSQKLDLVYQAVNEPAPAAAPGEPGA